MTTTPVEVRYVLRETRTNHATGRYAVTVSPLSAISTRSPLGQMMLFGPNHPRLRRLEAWEMSGSSVLYEIEEVNDGG